MAYVRNKSRTDRDETLKRYWRYVEKFLAYLDGEPVTDEAAALYAQELSATHRRNSRIPMTSAINWYLRLVKAVDADGEPIRLKVPSRDRLPTKRLLSEDEWTRLDKAATKRSLRDRVLLALLRETLLRPGDVCGIRLENLALDAKEGPRLERLTQQKTGNPVSPVISIETARVLAAYLGEYRPAVYVFEPEPGRPFHRRWPWERLRVLSDDAGIEPAVTPRLFRRTGATFWAGDVVSLTHQGGWASVKTPLEDYVQPRMDAQRTAFDKTFAKAEPKRTAAEDRAGYL
jgi:integrase